MFITYLSFSNAGIETSISYSGAFYFSQINTYIVGLIDCKIDIKIMKQIRYRVYRTGSKSHIARNQRTLLIRLGFEQIFLA